MSDKMIHPLAKVKASAKQTWLKVRRRQAYELPIQFMERDPQKEKALTKAKVGYLSRWLTGILKKQGYSYPISAKNFQETRDSFEVKIFGLGSFPELPKFFWNDLGVRSKWNFRNPDILVIDKNDVLDNPTIG